MIVPNSKPLKTVITKDQWINWNTSVWSIDLTMESTFTRSRGSHPCPSTPELYYRLMLLFTKPNEFVLDPFSGTGTGGVVARKINRNFLGLEVNPVFCNLAMNNLKNISNKFSSNQRFLNENSKDYNLQENSIDLIITSPPYFNNIRYSTLNSDLSNFKNLEDYLEKVANTFKNLQTPLKRGKFLCIIIGDSQKGKKLIPIHSLLSQRLKKLNFELTHIFINHFPDGTKKKEAKRSIGFPNYMYVEFDHEYILIFQNNKIKF